jgi:hypothetical protein
MPWLRHAGGVERVPARPRHRGIGTERGRRNAARGRAWVPSGVDPRVQPPAVETAMSAAVRRRHGSRRTGGQFDSRMAVGISEAPRLVPFEAVPDGNGLVDRRRRMSGRQRVACAWRPTSPGTPAARAAASQGFSNRVRKCWMIRCRSAPCASPTEVAKPWRFAAARAPARRERRSMYRSRDMFVCAGGSGPRSAGRHDAPPPAPGRLQSDAGPAISGNRPWPQRRA